LIAARRTQYAARRLTQLPIARTNPLHTPEAERGAAVEWIAVIFLFSHWLPAGKAVPLAPTLLDSGGGAPNDVGLLSQSSVQCLMIPKLSRNCIGSSKTLLSVQ
jgi:hypothetical protein